MCISQNEFYVFMVAASKVENLIVSQKNSVMCCWTAFLRYAFSLFFFMLFSCRWLVSAPLNSDCKL